MKKRCRPIAAVLILAFLLLPGLTWAAGGGEVAELVVVADIRIVDNPILRYFADLYNFNVTLFAVWAVVLTAAYGAFLGFLMDAIMKRTGLDLSKRTIVEH